MSRLNKNYAFKCIDINEKDLQAILQKEKLLKDWGFQIKLIRISNLSY